MEETTTEKQKNWDWRETLVGWRSLPKTVALLFKAAPGAATVMFSVQLLWGLLPVVEIFLGKDLFDAVQATLEGNPTPILPPLLMMLGVLFIGRATWVIFDLVDIRFRALVNLKIQAAVMERAMAVNLATREGNNFQNLVEKISNGSWRITQMVFALASAFGEIVSVVALVISLMSFSPFFVLLVTVTKLIQAGIANYMGSVAWKLTEGNAEEVRRSRMLFSVAVHKEAAKEVRLFGLSEEILKRYRQILTTILDADTSKLKFAAVLVMLVDAISVTFYGLVYWSIIQSTLARVLTLGDMALYSSGFLKLDASMRGIAWSMKQVDEGLRYYVSVHEMLSLKSESEGTGMRKMPKGSFSIEFDDVGFHYPGSEKYALRHASFKIEAGERVGLVGENGAGKTTLLKLLTHLYEPSEGRILINGIDYREYDVTELRRAITIVFQDFARFDISAKENISFGDVKRAVLQKEIQKSAELSGAASVIERLPNQYETILSTGFTKGTELSGGEWQKVALSRALYRQKAGLVVLDEPTSAFDARAEFDFFQEFLKVAKQEGKSAVIISHRFSNIRIADRIVVLQAGTVLEVGTHDELMANEGLYANLYMIQKDSLA